MSKEASTNTAASTMAVARTDSPLALVAATSNGPPAQFVRDALIGQNIQPFNLGQIRVPAIGSKTWVIEGLTGTEERKELDVIIMAQRANLRAWHRQPYKRGEGGPPDCASDDGISGMGDNTEAAPSAADGPRPATKHDCVSCRWSQWGSKRGADGSKAQDCAEFILAAVVQPNALLPDVLKIPATSLKPMQKYSLMLMREGKLPWSVLTRLTYDEAIVPSMVRDLTKDELDALLPVSAVLKEWLGHARVGGTAGVGGVT